MEYQILRSRRKTLSIEITPRGEIIVRTPSRMAKRDIQRFVESRRDWIEDHLSRIPNVTPLTETAHKALIRAAKEILPQKAAFFAQKMGITFGRITIRSQHTRWGSCSAAGNLSFNCLLMLAPEEVQDYVVVHELCHRREMNHSPRFWALVADILPDHRTQRQWLKENGASLMARLPDSDTGKNNT